jgi:cytochrome c biogenesis protein CcmG/thiol:disulfide interchange protein DsbE
MMATHEPGRKPRRRRLLLWAPALIFVVIGAVLAIGLTRDPEVLPSVLVGKPAPAFDLPPIPGRDDHGFSRADLGGQPMLVNVFASWCIPCRVEHPVLSGLAQEGVVLQGINYKDAPADVKAWLNELGDPFQHIGSDRNGRAGIEFGVYGVPETFVIDGDGQIVYRQVGPVQPQDLPKIRTILAELKQK